MPLNPFDNSPQARAIREGHELARRHNRQDAIRMLFFIAVLALLLGWVSGAFAQDKPKPAAANPDAPKAATAAKREPALIQLPARQLICQPRTAQCVSCPEADPCFVYGIATRPVAEK